MCIGDDDLFSYWCWLRNADLDNRGITMTGERCIHECVCKEYREWYARFAAVVDEPCRDPSCQHDTRTRPHTPAPSRKYTDDEFKERFPAHCDAIARAATLAENKRVIESFEDYIEGECYFTVDEMRDFIESLRAKPEQEARK